MSEQAFDVDQIPLLDGSSPSGCMLIDMALQQVLGTALKQVKADPTVVDSLFYKLPAATRTDVKGWLGKQNVAVRTGYPQTNFVEPMVAIICESDEDQTQQDLLGDMMGEEGVLSGTSAAYTYGYRERSTFNIMCICPKDPNAVLWLYHLVKAILLVNKDLLMRHGACDPITISGRDMSFREEMPAEWAFMRVIQFSCTHMFSVYVTQQIAHTLQVQILPSVPVAVEFTAR